MSNIIGSKYVTDYSSEIKEGVIGSGIPYYINKEKVSIINQFKIAIDCLINQKKYRIKK